MHEEVKQRLARYDAPVREQMLVLREIVLSEAARHSQVGELEETLKWGQLSYLPSKPRVGTTVRFDLASGGGPQLAMFLNCNTSLVDTIRQLYPETFEFRGNREVAFEAGAKLPETQLRHCIALALTYHLANKV